MSYDVEFGHTSYETAFRNADVYGVKPDAKRAAKRRLRVGVAGCGGVAQAKWLPAIRFLQMRSEPIEIAGLADPNPATLAKVAEHYKASAYGSTGELIDRGDTDLILVTCPDEMHGQVAQQSLTAGIPVLVEKPLCRRPEEARALCALAEERGVLLASVANKRFSPPYALAHKLANGGALKSAPTLFSGKFTLGYPYVDLLEAGAIHVIDLALWFMGSVERVFAVGTLRNGKIENAIILLNFSSGAVGSIVTSATALSFKPWERVEIIGRNAMLVVEDQFELTLYDEETGPAKSWRPTIPNTLLFDESFGGYAGLLENTLDAVRGIGSLVATGRDGARAVELVAAIHESLAGSEVVELGAPARSAPKAGGRK
jgi:predicted dehydrogenase